MRATNETSKGGHQVVTDLYSIKKKCALLIIPFLSERRGPHLILITETASSENTDMLPRIKPVFNCTSEMDNFLLPVCDAVYLASLRHFADHEMQEFLCRLVNETPEPGHRPAMTIFLSNLFACEHLTTHVHEHFAASCEFENTFQYTHDRYLPDDTGNPRIPLVNVIASNHALHAGCEADINVVALRTYSENAWFEVVVPSLIRGKKRWYFLACLGDRTTIKPWPAMIREMTCV